MKPLSQLTSIAVGGLTFFAVCLVALSLAVTPISLAMIGDDQVPSLSERQPPGRWLGLLLSAIVAFYASFPVARCIGRFLPLRLDGRRRFWLILACGVMGASLPFALGSMWRDRPDFTLVLAAVLMSAVIVWTLLWQIRSTRALDTPFILYLRRFSSFSDRSLLAGVLAARPTGYRAVFLAPTEDVAANFSPMVMAFSGTRLWRPLGSCPIPVSARNVEWEDNVEDLARAAAGVVIDVSDQSRSIAREIGIVQERVPPEKVLWLADESTADADLPSRGSGHVVKYQRSWRAALPRIVLELLAVGVVGVTVGGTLSGDARFASYPPWTFVLAGLSLVALAVPVIWQPSLGKGVRGQIKRSLRTILSARTERARTSGAAPPWKPHRRYGVLLARDASERIALIAQAVEASGLEAIRLIRPTDARSLREAIRRLSNAAVVVAEAAHTDPAVAYLLGIAHGLGRKVVTVADDQAAANETTPIQLTSVAPASVHAVSAAIDAVLRDPFHQGPAASLLANRWVFGERLTARRLAAFLIDAALSTGIAFLFLAWTEGLAGARPPGSALVAPAILILVTYRFLGCALTGTTLGMAALGLRLADADGGRLRPGQALGRSAATFVACLPFAAVLAALFGPRYQVLEDCLSDTRVVRRSS